MADYLVEIKRSASQEIEDLPSKIGQRIFNAIEKLGSEPRPRQSKKLAGGQSSYRLRVGPYRVLYQIDDRHKLISVFAVGHRSEVYRRRG